MLHLDQNRIVIRQRDFVDILDLALKVVRTHAGPLGLALAVGIVPMALLNAWLLVGWLEADFELGYPATYIWLMTLLVIWQIPLATAPATIYLGKALFVGRPEPRAIARDYAKSLPQLIIYQVILRGLLMLPIVTCLLLFVVWPYLNEILLLERNPLRAKTARRISTWRRCQALHSRQWDTLFVRWLGSLAVGGLLFGSIWCSIWIVTGMFLAEWEWSESMFSVYFPLTLWLLVGYFCVVRFLGYLDLRIGREGWEVELAMRAERSRLTKQMMGST